MTLLAANTRRAPASEASAEARSTAGAAEPIRVAVETSTRSVPRRRVWSIDGVHETSADAGATS